MAWLLLVEQKGGISVCCLVVSPPPLTCLFCRILLKVQVVGLALCLVREFLIVAFVLLVWWFGHFYVAPRSSLITSKLLVSTIVYLSVVFLLVVEKTTF